MGHKYEQKIVGRNTNKNIKKTDTEHYRKKKTFFHLNPPCQNIPRNKQMKKWIRMAQQKLLILTTF